MVWVFGEVNVTQFNLFSKAPNGDLYTKWEEYKNSLKKLTPEEANKYKVIAVSYTHQTLPTKRIV